MRIVISNPDGIGDVVLRLPLFEALREAGHELLLLCRESSRPLLERLGAGISVVAIRENPYQETPTGETVFEGTPFDAARKFSPDLLVFAPYQWTVFEERLAWALVDVPRIRMNGHRSAHWPKKATAPPPPDRERVVPVERQWHEIVKNQALCRAILGREVELKDPTILIREEDIERGRACLREAFGGSPPDDFWIGCVGHAGDYWGILKDWGRDNWVHVLRYMAGELKKKVLLVGNLAERESLQAIRSEAGIEGNIEMSAGEARDAEDFSRLLGLTWLARGYIGKDTGPMHIAAALKKPVVAVFGGGHWPQFTPVVTPSLALAVGLPCMRCEWVCHLPESLCVKRVPVSSVKEAVAAIVSGEMLLREARLIAPSVMLVEAATRRKLQAPVTIQIRKHLGRLNMSEATGQDNLSTAGAMNGVEASLLTGLADLREEVAELKSQIMGKVPAMGGAEDVEQLREELKKMEHAAAEREREEARRAGEKNDQRIQALTQELKAMTQAAIEREREYSRRDMAWNEKVLQAATQAREAKFEASQLADKLTKNEYTRQEIAAAEGRLRTRIGEQELLLHASNEKINASNEKINALELERNLLETRVKELSFSRSRRLLLKLHLVSRCAWETS